MGKRKLVKGTGNRKAGAADGRRSGGNGKAKLQKATKHKKHKRTAFATNTSQELAHAEDADEGADIDVATLGFADALSVGLTFQQLDAHESAVEAFQRAVQLQPDHYGARTRLADAFAECGDFAAALPHYRAASAQSDADASLWLRLGVALSGVDDAAAAMASFETATAKAADEIRAAADANDADEADARRTYGMALAARANALAAEQGDVDAAADVYRAAVAEFPTNANLHFNLATMLLAKGDATASVDAIASLKRAIACDGAVVEFYEELLGVLSDADEIATYGKQLEELKRTQKGADEEEEEQEEEEEEEEEEESDDDEDEGDEDDEDDEDDEHQSDEDEA